MAAPSKIADWLPIWVTELVLPVAFAVMALRFVLQAEGWTGKGVALLGLPTVGLVGFALEAYTAQLLWPGIILLLVAAILGWVGCCCPCSCRVAMARSSR